MSPSRLNGPDRRLRAPNGPVLHRRLGACIDRWALARAGRHGTQERGVHAWPVSAPERRAHRAPRGDPRAPGRVRVRNAGARGGLRIAAVRGTGVPRVPHVRDPVVRRGAAAMRGVRPRPPAALLVQGTRVLPELWGTAHDRAGGPPGRRGVAPGSRAAMGAEPAARVTLPAG